jgi:transitional endoplasmic reticulum ATPase
MKTTQLFLLHDGPQAFSRELLLKVFLWADDLHDEIWVFDSGYWRKDHDIWSQVQKADWKDIILKDAFKKDLQKDIYGFFTSENTYKELAIPWKVQ